MAGPHGFAGIVTLGIFSWRPLKTGRPLSRLLPRRHPLEGPHGFAGTARRESLLTITQKPVGPSDACCLGGIRWRDLAVFEGYFSHDRAGNKICEAFRLAHVAWPSRADGVCINTRLPQCACCLGGFHGWAIESCVFVCSDMMGTSAALAASAVSAAPDPNNVSHELATLNAPPKLYM